MKLSSKSKWLLLFIGITVGIIINQQRIVVEPAPNDALHAHDPQLDTPVVISNPAFAITENIDPIAAPNVVIFLMDTLRADRLATYGHTVPTSPSADALAKESVLFTRCDSAAPWTLPSIVSLMSSKYPVEHGVLTDGRVIKDSEVLLSERLQQLGFVTASFYANVYAGRPTGMTRGFDHAELTIFADGEKIQKHLETLPTDRPFFLYVHNTEPHNPFELRVNKDYLEPDTTVSYEQRIRMLDLYETYRAATAASDEGDTSALQKEKLDELYALKSEGAIDALYDASVKLGDELMGDIIQTLKTMGHWDNTLFIFVADHGEEMGEHGAWQHDQSVYPELVHVPLMIHFPSNEYATQTRDEAVTLVDIVPTVLEILNQPKPETSGISLLPLITDPETSSQSWKDSIRFTSQRVNLKKHYTPIKEQRGDIKIVMHQGPWKAIWNVETDSVELYDCIQDPNNENDVAAKHPERCAEFKSAAQERFGLLTLEQLKKGSDSWDLDAQEIENLTNLVYL